MKLCIFPRYDRLGASSRLRSYQYLPYIQTDGIEFTVAPLFSDEYVRRLYSNSGKFLPILKGYWKRVQALWQIKTDDVLYIEKELFPWLPAGLELFFIPKRVKCIIDLDDAVFHRYDEHRFWLVRKLLGCKIDSLMKHADLVMAGNEYLAQRARAAGCRWVEIIPTVIDLNRYPPVKRQPVSGTLTVGWIGSPATADYLGLVAEAAADIANTHDVRFAAIGARPDQLSATSFKPVTWTEDTEVASLQSLDIGIMPLPDAPWERGKCGYKLIQYMACGLPVIASPVGVNTQIVKHGVNGYLAATAQQWRDAMDLLLQDSALREKLGRAGRETVEAEYCLQVIGPKMVELFRKLHQMEFDKDR